MHPTKTQNSINLSDQKVATHKLLPKYQQKFLIKAEGLHVVILKAL